MHVSLLYFVFSFRLVLRGLRKKGEGEREREREEEKRTGNFLNLIWPYGFANFL